MRSWLRMMRMPASTISLPVVDEAEVAVQALKFLSEPNRLRILRILARRESCVCELIEHLGLPQPSVSYHLKDSATWDWCGRGVKRSGSTTQSIPSRGIVSPDQSSGFA